MVSKQDEEEKNDRVMVSNQIEKKFPLSDGR